MVVRPKHYQTGLMKPNGQPTLFPGCGEGGWRPSGLEAWETLEDPSPERAEWDVVRQGTPSKSHPAQDAHLSEGW